MAPTCENTPPAGSSADVGSDAAAPLGLPRSATQESIPRESGTPATGADAALLAAQQLPPQSSTQGFAMNQLFKTASMRASRASLPSTSIALPETGATSERRQRHTKSVPRVAPRQLQLVFDMFAMDGLQPWAGNDGNGGGKRISLSGLREVVSLLHVEDMPKNEFEACVREACHGGDDAALPVSLDYPEFLNFVAMMSRRVPADEYSAEKLYAMLNASKTDEHVSDDQLAAVLESIGLHLTEEQAELMTAAANVGGARSSARNITFQDFHSVWSRRKTNTTGEISNRRSTISTGDAKQPP